MLRKKLLAFALSTALVLTAVPVYADNDPITGSANAAPSVSPNTTVVTQENGDPSGDSDKKDEDNNGGEGGNTTVSPDSTLSPESTVSPDSTPLPEGTVSPDNAEADKKDTVSDPSASEENDETLSIVSENSLSENTVSDNGLTGDDSGVPFFSTGYLEPDVEIINNAPVPKRRLLRSSVNGASNMDPSLPSSYKSDFTPVRAQGDTNTCWVFAPMAAAEASLLKKGKNLNLSEKFNSYYTWNPVSGFMVPEAEDDYKKVNSGNYLKLGGNAILVGGTLSAWKGLAEEKGNLAWSSDTPACDTEVARNVADTVPADAVFDNSPYHVQDVKIYKAEKSSLANDIKTVKQMILDYGAVTMAIRSFGGHNSEAQKEFKGSAPPYEPWTYDSNSKFVSLYNYEDFSGDSISKTDHEVCVVGWDDDFDNYNSTVSNNTVNPNYRKGAWLVKNSWGKSSFSRDDGLMAVSYYDTSALADSVGFVAYTVAAPGDSNYYDNNYQINSQDMEHFKYDGSGSRANTSYYEKKRDNYSYGVLYSANAKTGFEKLKAVQIYTDQTNTTVNIRIYRNPDHSSGTYKEKAGDLIYNYNHELSGGAGYRNIPLSDSGIQSGEDLKLAGGDEFLVVVSNVTEANVYVYNKVNLNNSNFLGRDVNLSYTNVASGKSFSGTGSQGSVTLNKTTAEDYYLKVFTNNIEETATDLSDTTKTTVTGVEKSYKYTGQSYESDILSGITVKYNGTTLTKDKDYEISTVGSFKDADSVSYIYINGIRMYKGRVSVPVTIRGKETFNVDPIPDVKYTGYKHEVEGSGTSTGVSYDLELTVKNDGEELSRGSDYNVSYYNNTAVGSAGSTKPPYVVVTGLGIYNGYKITRQFNIVADNSVFDDLNINLEHTYYRNNNAKVNLNPSVKIKQKDAYGAEKTVTLKKNTDYTIAYQRYENGWSSATTTVNSDGHWRAVITGKGNYSGCSFSDASTDAYTGIGHFQVVSNSSPKASQLSISVKLKQGLKTPEIKTAGTTINIDSYYTITVKQKQNGKQVELAEGTGYKYYLCKADKTPEGDTDTKTTGDAGDHYIRIVPGTSNLFSGSKDVKIKINGLSMPASKFSMVADGTTYSNNGQIPYDGKETTAQINLDGAKVGEMKVGAYAGTYQHVYYGTGVYGGKKVTLKLKRKAMPLADANITWSTTGTTYCNVNGAYPTITVTIPGESSSQTLNLATQSSYGGIQFKVSNNKRVGNGSITAKAVGNSRFTGSKKLGDFTITANTNPTVIGMGDVSANSIDNANKIVFVAEDVSKAYTRPAVRGIQYSADGSTYKTLSNGRDYTFSYIADNSTKKGTVTITSGINGNYTFNGLTVSYGVYTFKKNIDKVNGSAAMPDVAFNSTPYPLVRPEITSVTVGGSTYNSSCFDVEYSDNYKKGTGKATIYLHSDITGGVTAKKTFNFKIK